MKNVAQAAVVQAKMPSAISRAYARLLISRAREAQQRGDWAAAARSWRSVVEADPNNVRGWTQLGNMLNELERRDEAITAFRRAGELDPKLAHAPAGVAGVHERAQQWHAAEAAWTDAVALLSASDLETPGAREELTHALLHAALSAGRSGAPRRSIAYVEQALNLAPGLLEEEEYLNILMDLSAPQDLEAMPNMIGIIAALLPGHVRDEAGAIPDTLPDGLLALAPFLHFGRDNPKFLKLAIILYERFRLWGEVIQLAEWQADLDHGDLRPLEHAFRAAADGRRLADARRIARLYTRRSGEHILVHELAKLYKAAGRLDRARLLTRFVCRKWPHSRWHAHEYIRLTALSRSLLSADRLIQAEIKAGRRDRDLEQAYCVVAYDAGNYNEARLRLQAYLEQHDDQDAEVLLGYVLANSTSLAEADRHFEAAAARQMQTAGTTVGLAHMAMRRRDFPAALDRWRRVAALHPELTFAHVEIARCAYEMRDVEEAERVCVAFLRRYPHDVAVREFYAWLLTVNGRYEEAQVAIGVVQQTSGPSWDMARLAILCAAELGTLERDWNRITTMMPSSDDDEAASRFYHAVRSLIAVGQPDFASKLLQRQPFAGTDLAWRWSYVRSSGEAPDADPSRGTAARWHAASLSTRSDFNDRLNGMSDTDVDRLLARTDGFATVHVINKFEQPRGGSELHALDLAAQLSSYTKVDLWAPEMPHPQFTVAHGVRAIDPGAGKIPQGGVLVLVGIYYDVAKWIGMVQPERVIFLYNTFEAPSLFQRIDDVFRRTGVRPELLYCSTMMQDETGLAGRFEPSPTDLDLFAPSTDEARTRPFRLGRHSRDVVEKHGSQDWRVYQAVADAGGESVVLGGTCMRRAYPMVPNLHLLPARSDGIPDFLRSLDAYFYRTSTWIEPWGRVVIEAMACGLPVLAHSVGGYAQAIEHEVNGLLFDTTEEAVRLVRRLAEEPLLRERLGREACVSACKLLSAAEMRRLLAFYLLCDTDPA